MTPRLIVRADAHAAIGSGHAMRCLALAQAWQDRGGEVTFVGVLDETTVRRLRDEGCSTILASAAHPNPADLTTLRAALDAAPGAVLALDGYGFDVGYLYAVRRWADRLLVLDDMALLPDYPCHVLLNPNFAAEVDYAGRTSARILAGPTYAMLRRDLASRAAEARQERTVGGPLRVLITFGGSDPADGSRIAIQAASLMPAGMIDVRCVVGPSHPRADSVRALGREHGVEVLVAVRDMASQLAWADLAVTASGGTSWELAAFGVPALYVVVAENQRRVAEGMAAHGAARLLGDAVGLTSAAVARALRELHADRDSLAAMAAQAATLVDGAGASRVAAALASHDG